MEKETLIHPQQLHKTLNLSSKNIEKNKSIKFISYSNKLKPEIQKIYDNIGVCNV
jgi:3'(2'), 5'-bisphosphate nucleotidase